ncbi:MAG TPA: peptidoglycan endopeptidase [Allosphingosinicella sp.]|nr:peptidoglycan endopeptidase [Allosphingosinicella sp.]
MNGMDIAARARALVGTRFRPQGRHPNHGLDCVGLAALACGIPVERVPRDYHLRGQSLADIEDRLRDLGCRPVAGPALEPGDVVLCQAGPAQYHMVVIAPSGFVHADAALRRVVERPYPIPWTLTGAWRLAKEEG